MLPFNTHPRGELQEPTDGPPSLLCCREIPQSLVCAGVHALDVWDDQPAADWTASYPLGNGFLGAMLGMGTFKVRVFR